MKIPVRYSPPHQRKYTILQLIQDKTYFRKLTPMLKWGKDIGQTFSNSQWLASLKYSLNAPRSSSLHELVYKFTLHWYITPSMIHKFDTSTPPLCWRNYGAMGKLYCILWECPMVSSFLRDTFRLLSKITTIHTNPSPALALIGIE